MTIHKSKTVAWLLLVAVSVLLTGCFKLNLDECPDDDWTLTVRAYDNSGVELTESEVPSVMLYLFDGDNRFIERIPAELGRGIRLGSLPAGDIRAVAWGNLASDYTVDIAEPWHDSRIDLTLNANDYMILSDDIFLGDLSIEGTRREGDKELPIYRALGSMSITVRGLDRLTGTMDDDYFFTIRETCSQISFGGNFSGEKVIYKPVLTGNASEFKVEPFLMVPQANGLWIDVFREGDLFASVSHSSEGEPIAVHCGQTTHVLIEFKEAGIEISVSLTPWVPDGGEKEF